MDITTYLNDSLEGLREKASGCESTFVPEQIKHLAQSQNLVVDEHTRWAFLLGELAMLYETIDTLWDAEYAELPRKANALFAKADEIRLILINKKPTEPFDPFDL